MRTDARQPTYEATERCLHAFLALLRAPHGREHDALAAELGVSTKTMSRYTKVLQRSLFDHREQSILEVTRKQGRKWLKLRGAELEAEPGIHQAASMFFSVAALRALRGTSVGETTENLWARTLKKLPLKTREALDQVEKRFFYVPFAAKEYRDSDEVIDQLFQSVLRKKQLQLKYRKPNRRLSHHVFDPYTLVLYRDAIYVLGASSRHVSPIYLAVDRIEEIALTGKRFRLPKDYDPESLTRGGFGIWSGRECEVSLRLSGRAAEQIPERRLHSSQRHEMVRGGDVLMHVTVQGWQELAWWILSWGSEVEVLGPADLRSYVAREVRAAARLYSPR